MGGCAHERCFHVAEHLEGLIDLGLESPRGLEEIEQLRVVHLEKHARDLRRQRARGVRRQIGVLVALHYERVEVVRVTLR